jgi:ATP-dependent RNA helicase SUPV3L1/SUV3
VLCAPAAEELVTELVREAGMSLESIAHERLAPLEVAAKCWSLEHLLPRTILIAFSRFMVLALKTELEKVHHRSVSVVYGNLPPEVRRIQAARFLSGETEICVATDAVGMGLNLPADYVCFFEVDKFDGRARRALSAMEIQQIGGRAGRFGLSQSGEVGALTKPDLTVLRRAFAAAVLPLEFARVAPSPQALALIPGHLSAKLDEWQRLSSIPDQWRHLLQPMDLTEQISLAASLSGEEIDQLGLETTLRLINAPTQKETRPYWSLCARAILEKAPMPWPTQIHEIQTSQELMRAEESIRSADIYRWLACREEFAAFGPDADQISALRREWCQMVDHALQVKIDTSRRCNQCGRKIPLHHPFGICESCHRSRW